MIKKPDYSCLSSLSPLINRHTLGKRDTEKLPNKERVWIEVIKIGREIFRRTTSGIHTVSVTFDLKKGPTTYHYNPMDLPDQETIRWIKVPSSIKTKCPMYSEECKEINIPDTRKTIPETPKARSGPPILAKTNRGTSLNTYYIENRSGKRKGDISIQIGQTKIDLTPIKGISGRFPELYKHLSVATQKHRWTTVNNKPPIEILNWEIKRDITDFVLKNLDTPSPERRLGPRSSHPSRIKLFP